jgi:hypothetical protein
MNRRIDIEGQRFGRLVVKRFHSTINGVTRWECECDCGNSSIVYSNNLRRGITKSCGCIHKEKSKETATKHGLSETSIYRAHYAIKQRCLDENNYCFKNYGGRGITICEEWLDDDNGLINFYNWALSNGYSEGLTIDRIDNNGNYEPSNCRWATMKQQQNNKRNNHIIDFNGEHKTITEWARELGMNKRTLRTRICECGWDAEKALNTKIRIRRAN